MNIKRFKSVLRRKAKKNTRVPVTVDTKKKPQALGTPSDFSGYTIKTFQATRLSNKKHGFHQFPTVLNHLLLHTYYNQETNLTMILVPAQPIRLSTHIVLVTVLTYQIK